MLMSLGRDCGYGERLGHREKVRDSRSNFGKCCLYVKTWGRAAWGAGIPQRTPRCPEVFGHEVPGRSLGAWDLAKQVTVSLPPGREDFLSQGSGKGTRNFEP